MKNIPEVKLGIIAVSRDCFPIELSKKRREAIVKAYSGEIYECPIAVENEVDMLEAVKDVALKECNWLSDSDFHAKKVDLLRKVSAIDDYVTKVEIYIASPKMGLISEEDYNLKKEEFIADIFKPHESTEEFQVSVKKLMDLEKVGMLTSDEFTNYKMKLMSEL